MLVQFVRDLAELGEWLARAYRRGSNPDLDWGLRPRAVYTYVNLIRDSVGVINLSDEA